MKKQTLYFQQMGMDLHDPEFIGTDWEKLRATYRNRTVFTNKNGDRVFFEFSLAVPHKHSPKWMGKTPKIVIQDFFAYTGNIRGGSLGYTETKHYSQRGDLLPADIKELKQFIKEKTGVEFAEVFFCDEFDDFDHYAGSEQHLENLTRAKAGRDTFNAIVRDYATKTGRKYPCLCFQGFTDTGITIRATGTDAEITRAGWPARCRNFDFIKGGDK